MKLISKIGAISLVHPVHGQVDANPDGTFDVSPELGAELLGFSTQWATPEGHLADAHEVEMSDLHDLTVPAVALAGLREDVAVLRAGGTLEAPYAGRWQPDARTLAWCALHVQGNAAGIAEWSALAVEIDTLQREAATRLAAEAAAKPAEVEK